MSLSSTAMSIPLRIILKEMQLSLDVQMALLERSGQLGDILNAVEYIEKFNLEPLKEFMLKYKLSANALEQLMTQNAQVMHNV
jgi:c-di-GMP-related signal transduction protein